jgi:uncharacterized RDD family membrane protein YckC
MNAGVPLEAASLARRLGALAYEVLLLLALLFFSAFAFQGATSSLLEGWIRHLFQVYLFLVAGLYFVLCWMRGGQTLPMKTWRLKLVCADGSALPARKAVLRYLLAWLSVLAAGFGFLWAALDRDGQFLHDRLAGTRIVKA